MKNAMRMSGLAALYLISAGAGAQGWITGGAIGQARQMDYEVGGPIVTRDDNDSSGRIFGGYMISPIQGIVVSYLDLGQTHYDGPAYGGFDDYLEVSGFDISYIIGWAPGSQERVSLFGTLGFFTWDQDVTLTEMVETTPAEYLYRDSGSSFSLGLGAEINFSGDGTSAWGIHFEWQTFEDVGESGNSGQEYDWDLFSIGASYHFGRN